MTRADFSRRCTVAMDIGGSHVTAAAIDVVSGSIIPGTKVVQSVDSHASADEILGRWVNAARHALSLCEEKRLDGVGIAMPGPFDYEQGICLMEGVGKYESLFGLNIREQLKRRLDIAHHPMIFRNDALCFTLGENWMGAARDCNRVIGVTLGTGFGSAFIKDGVIVDDGRDVPPNGWLYCLSWRSGTADDAFSTQGLLSSYRKVTGKEADNVRDLADEAKQDETLREVFTRFGKDMGEFMAPWAKSFEAECIVVGGNISRAWELFGNVLSKSLRRGAPLCEVRSSFLLDDAALLGAGLLPLKYEEPQPEQIL